jgi:esterase/lipase
MSKENEDIDLLHKKIDLKQFSEMQTAIIKEQLSADLDKEIEKQNIKTNKVLNRYRNIVVLIVGGSIIGWVGLIFSMNKKVQKALENEVGKITILIQNRLNYEFSTPIITKLVEDKAQEYTEKNAKDYIEGQVTNKIKPYENAVQEKLNTADDRLKQAQGIIKQSEDQLRNINEQVDIFTLQSDALSGDRKAFDKLLSSRFHSKQNLKTAENIFKTIIRSYAIYQEIPSMYQDVYFTTPSGKTIEIKNLTAFEIYKYAETPFVPVEHRRVMMLYISQKPKKDILESSLNILRNSESLDACAVACGVLKNTLKRNDVNFMDFDGWIKAINEELKKQ